MRSKATQSIPAHNGVGVPNPRYYGFKWREEQDLLDRMGELWDELKGNGREVERLQADNRELETERQHQRALALIGEGNPTESVAEKIADNEREAAQLAEKAHALHTAGEMLAAKFHQAVGQNAIKRLEDLGRLDEREASEIAALEGKLQELRSRRDGRSALRSLYERTAL